MISLKKLQNEHFAVYEFHFVDCAEENCKAGELIWIKLEADKCHAQQEDSWFEWKARRKTWNIIIAETKCEIYGNFTNCYTSFPTFFSLFLSVRVVLIIQEKRKNCLMHVGKALFILQMWFWWFMGCGKARRKFSRVFHFQRLSSNFPISKMHLTDFKNSFP